MASRQLGHGAQAGSWHGPSHVQGDLVSCKLVRKCAFTHSVLLFLITPSWSAAHNSPPTLTVLLLQADAAGPSMGQHPLFPPQMHTQSFL